MKTKVYIDGQEGTTGLKIVERLEERSDITLLKIDSALRKDPQERQRLMNQSDYTILCLPDVAAIEAVSLIENEAVKVIDASTAHRTHEEWAYGFPELSSQHRQKIQSSKRVAVPGCYASGFAALVYPLVTAGILPQDYPIVCHATSGYSGGGKQTIQAYEATPRPIEYEAPRLYALEQQHKHLKEMQFVSNLDYAPIFNPIIADYYQGMTVAIPLHTRLLTKGVTVETLQQFFMEHYANQSFIKVSPTSPSGFLGANGVVDSNELEIYLSGHEEQILLVARLDNLGKGASGAAVQCLNIMMGIDETTSLKE